MAQGFEAYHVPQQSRRDRLRVLSHHHSPSDHLLHFDPSILPSPPADLFSYPSSDRLVKEEPSSNLLRFVGDSRHHLYAPSDTQPSSSANPSSIQEDNQAFSCTCHDLGNVGRPVHPSYYGSVDSAVSGCDGNISGSSCRGLSLSLWSRVNSQGGGCGDDRGNVPLPLPLPLLLPPHPPLELNLERYESALACCDRSSRCFGEVMIGPLGPFTGYSSVLRGSRFLKPAQQLLEELCNAGMGIFAPEKASESESSLMEGGGKGFGDADELCRVGDENKSRLKYMLDEVCGRYKQYYQQLQNVVASFECVAGLRNASPYVNFALKVMSRHFKCLKDAIMDQFQFPMKAVRNTRVDIPRFETDERPHLGLRAIQNSGFLERQPVWRPQRGLPDRAVAVLRAWLFDHFLHPYPTDNDKLMLAKETGLSRSQVSNWFINARVRLWKPMVEEIHMLETQQMQKTTHTQHSDKRNLSTTSNDQFPLLYSVPLTSTPRFNDAQTYHLSHVVGENIGSAKTSSVTLTLGLQRQNNSGMSTSAVLPVGAVQQRLGLGLETNGEGEGHAMGGGYGSQGRHSEGDAPGGARHLLRNFSG